MVNRYFGEVPMFIDIFATSHMANAFWSKKNPASTSIFWEYVHAFSGKVSYMCSDFKGSHR